LLIVDDPDIVNKTVIQFFFYFNLGSINLIQSNKEPPDWVWEKRNTIWKQGKQNRQSIDCLFCVSFKPFEPLRAIVV